MTKIADGHALWQQEMQPLIADVCSRHPSIGTAQIVDGDETEKCMHRCIEVMRYICDGKKVIADPALVITTDSRSKLAQLLKDSQADVDSMIDAVHQQTTHYLQSQPSDAAIKQSDESQDALLNTANSGKLALQVSNIRQHHKHLLSSEEQTDEAWLDKVFKAIDKMNTKLTTSLEVKTDGLQKSTFDLAEQLVSTHNSQINLIKNIEDKVDKMLGNSAVSIGKIPPNDVLVKIDLLFEAREHITDHNDAAASKQKKMIDMCNQMFPAEIASIDEHDNNDTIQSKIDAAIKYTHQQLAATETNDPEERRKLIEAIQQKQYVPDAAVMSRIDEVVTNYSRWSMSIRERS